MNGEFGAYLRRCHERTRIHAALRSLVDDAASLAINMALLTELFAAPPPRFWCMKGAYKVQALCRRTP